MPKQTTTGPCRQVPEAAQAFGAGFPEQRGAEGEAVVAIDKGSRARDRLTQTGDRQQPATWGFCSTARVLGKATLRIGSRLLKNRNTVGKPEPPLDCETGFSAGSSSERGNSLISLFWVL